ncbi:hypothetical protein [Arthrobacter sp. SO3]|uniref:hypothetical protein n=1 Tax=Arthrobacter sp. SO3 TaxID=1897057 RepID=UPI001CFFCEE6|nr:hypothetical protein [Arthrobacter sp. SO3]MCB5290668.1 hypothetical protein [Arthrobacter sp. SO3]
MKSSRIIMTRLTWLSSKVLGSASVLFLLSPKDHPGNDHPERGAVKGWVIIALISAVGLAVLLVIAGPPLAALFNSFIARTGR